MSATLLLLATLAPAAPPTVTALYPAGAQRGTTVEVVATGTFERWPVQTWCDHPGIAVTPHKDRGKLTVTVAKEVPPGLYSLRLADEQGASALRPFFVGTLPEVADKEPNDDTRKPQVLAASAVVNGKLGTRGDVDCFALAVKKGQTLVAALEANRVLGSPMDAIVQITTATGAVVAENHDHRGLDPQATYTAPADGTYVVRVYAFPAMPDSTIAFAGGDLYIYRLTLTTGPYLDHAYPLAVPRATPGKVTAVGWNLPADLRQLPVTASGAVYHDSFAGTASVRLEPHATATQAGDEPQPLALPATVSGVLTGPARWHRYRVEAKKGQAVRLQLDSHSLGFAVTGVLRVTDATGKVVQRVEEAARAAAVAPDVALTFTPAQDGPHFLEVGDLFASSGPGHVYRLRCLTRQPDYQLTLAGDRFVVTPTKPLDVPVTIVRDNFAGLIEVSIEGLPAGVTVTPVTAKPAEKTVTLRLTATAAAVSGSVRVVGAVAGSADLRRVATEHVWLTVGK